MMLTVNVNIFYFVKLYRISILKHNSHQNYYFIEMNEYYIQLRSIGDVWPDKRRDFT